MSTDVRCIPVDRPLRRDTLSKLQRLLAIVVSNHNANAHVQEVLYTYSWMAFSLLTIRGLKHVAPRNDHIAGYFAGERTERLIVLDLKIEAS